MTFPLDGYCGNCKWYEPWFPYNGSALVDESAECTWPANRLPYSLRYGNRERMSVYPLDGSNCPCWERIEL